MDAHQARLHLNAARVGRLGTVTPDHRPHIVPCCFVLAEDTIYSVVDAKPKSTPNLRRLRNIESNDAASLLVDRYDEDWATLWWVRVDGRGRVLDDGAEYIRAIELLTAKYEQYLSDPPPGPVLAIAIDVWRMWP